MAPIRRTLVAASVLAALAVAVPSASASTLQVLTTVDPPSCPTCEDAAPRTHSVFQFTGANGEANDVTLEARDILGSGMPVAATELRISDSGAPLEAGEGCAVEPGGSVRCIAPVGTESVIALGDGDDRIRVLDAAPSTPIGVRIDAGAGRDQIVGGQGPDAIYPGAGDDAVDAGDGADRVYEQEFVASGRDTILGGPGDDRLYGGGDADTVGGGPGRDLLTGDVGADTLAGGDGGDVLRGGAGDDEIRGGPDDDWLFGGGGRDRLHGDEGDDGLADQDTSSAPDQDLLDGGPGRRDLVTYAGRTARVVADLNALTGGQRGEIDRLSGIEDLTGGRGNDLLAGDDRPNRLTGGPGVDVLSGRGGDDVAYGAGDRVRCGPGSDTVLEAGTGPRPARDCERLR